MPNASRFTVEQADGEITVVTLTDQQLMDTMMVSGFQDALIEFVADRDPRRLVIDFRCVKQCSTAVMNGLLRVKKRLVLSQGKLRLCNMNPHVFKAFSMLNLVGSVFQVDATLADSLTSLRGE
ncbi:MAG TPA: hypothetical protein DCY79_05600 [Planctomycetaceae bacterium]|nr:hypothetical protein [Blastopirellula sp.]HAY79265.1 hypothetical protein [Planctomycetaceae bacterium]|tara:strand:- start:285 stop:653 length:369 start_codon:yes stop_codon:yes gene_type:complete